MKLVGSEETKQAKSDWTDAEFLEMRNTKYSGRH